MSLKNLLKSFGVWAEIYQNLAEDDLQGCQNCIPGVDRNFFETLFCEKSLPLSVWILLEKTATFPQINVVRVVATAFYLSEKHKKHSTTKNKFIFQKKHNFQTILSCEPVLLDFWQKLFGSILQIAFYVSQKATGRKKFDLKVFLDSVCFSEQKRIRLL